MNNPSQNLLVEHPAVGFFLHAALLTGFLHSALATLIHRLSTYETS